MNDSEKIKNNDIIDAEFVKDDGQQNSNQKNTSNNFNDNIYLDQYKFNNNSSENFHEFNQKEASSFFYSFGSKNKVMVKRPSILTIILLLPFILISIIFLLFVGLITFVIFLPKIFRILRKKGISGIKMDYNFLRGLFTHFKVK